MMWEGLLIIHNALGLELQAAKQANEALQRQCLEQQQQLDRMAAQASKDQSELQELRKQDESLKAQYDEQLRSLGQSLGHFPASSSAGLDGN